MGNGRFYFNENSILDLYYILKRRYPAIKNNSSVIFIECTDMHWKKSNVNGFRVPILLKNMGWYLGVIRKRHNYECLICIFTAKVEDGNAIIFNKQLYHIKN